MTAQRKTNRKFKQANPIQVTRLQKDSWKQQKRIRKGDQYISMYILHQSRETLYSTKKLRTLSRSFVYCGGALINPFTASTNNKLPPEIKTPMGWPDSHWAAQQCRVAYISPSRSEARGTSRSTLNPHLLPHERSSKITDKVQRNPHDVAQRTQCKRKCSPRKISKYETPQ